VQPTAVEVIQASSITRSINDTYKLRLNESKQESRAVAGKPCDAAAHFDQYGVCTVWPFVSHTGIHYPISNALTDKTKMVIMVYTNRPRSILLRSTSQRLTCIFTNEHTL